MWGNATLAMVVSTICIMVAIITAPMMMRGCFVTSAGPTASLLGADCSRGASSTVTVSLASAIAGPEERAAINYQLPERPLFRRSFSARQSHR